MKKIDEKTLNENFKNLLIKELTYLGSELKEKLPWWIKGCNDFIYQIDYETLDDYFENNLGENDSSYDDVQWSYCVGYALLSRYGLDYDTYVNWAKKQNPKFAYSLLKLVGIEDAELGLEAENLRHTEIQVSEKENIKERIREFASCCSKYNRILIESSDGKVCFLGKNYEISPEVQKLGRILRNIRNSREKSDLVYYSGLKKCKKSYETCIELLGTVFDDTIRSYWISAKKILRQEGYSEAVIDDIEASYYAGVKSQYLKETFDNVYKNLYYKYEGQFEKLSNDYESGSPHQFIGGGFGLAGAAKGMITAGILNGVANGVVRLLATGVAAFESNQFEKQAYELYLGEWALEKYRETIDHDYEELENVIFEDLFNDKYGKTKIAKDFYDDIHLSLEQLSNQEIEQIIRNYVEYFPFCNYSYKLLSDSYCNINIEVNKMAESLQTDDILESECIYRDDEQAVFSDFTIEYGSNGFSLKNVILNGQAYSIEIPIKNIDINLWDADIYAEKDEFSIELEQLTIKAKRGSFEPTMDLLDVYAIAFFEDVESKDDLDIIPTGEGKSNGFELQFYKYDDEDEKEKIIICNDSSNYFIVSVTYDVDCAVDDSFLQDISIGKTNSELDIIPAKNYIENRISQSKDRIIQRLIDENDKDILAKKVAFRRRMKAILDKLAFEENKINKYSFESRDFSFFDCAKDETDIQIDTYLLYKSEVICVTDEELILVGDEEIIAAFSLEDIWSLGVFLNKDGIPEEFKIEKMDDSIETYIIGEDYVDEIIFISDVVNVASDVFFTERQVTGRSYWAWQSDKRGDKKLERREVVKDTKFDKIIAALNSVDEYSGDDLYEDELYIENVLHINDGIGTSKEENKEKVLQQSITGESELRANDIALNRQLLITIFNDNSSVFGNYIGKYLYELRSGYVRTTLYQINNISQFVIYQKKTLIITDQAIYYKSNDHGLLEFRISNLVELIPMGDSYGEKECKGFYARVKHGADKFYFDYGVKEVVEELCLINCMLKKRDKMEGIEQERLFGKAKKSENEFYTYCGNNRYFTTYKKEEGTVMNSMVCVACQKVPWKNHYNIISFDVDEMDRKIDHIIKESKEELCELALKDDIANDGLLDLYDNFYINFIEKLHAEQKAIEEQRQVAAEEDLERKKERVKAFADILEGTFLKYYLVQRYYLDVKNLAIKKKLEALPEGTHLDYVIYLDADVVITYEHIKWGELTIDYDGINEFKIIDQDGKNEFVIVKKNKTIALKNCNQHPLLFYALNTLIGEKCHEDIVSNLKRNIIAQDTPVYEEGFTDNDFNKYRLVVYENKVCIYNLVNSRANHIFNREDIKAVYVNPDAKSLMFKMTKLLEIYTYVGLKDVNYVKQIIEGTNRVATVVETSKIEKDTKFCSYCGKEIKRSAKFCNYCGKNTVN